MINSKVTDEIFEKLYSVAENRYCFECGTASYKWASVSNGIFLCIKCSGLHRGMGPNVSSVRSVEMDSWDEKYLNLMLKGGNEQLRQFFKGYQLAVRSNDAPIDFKYKTKAGIYYRERLRCLAQGLPIPEPPSLEEGLILVDFTNPNFNKGVVSEGISSQQQSNNQAEGSSVANFFSTALEKASTATKQAIEVTADAAKKSSEKIKYKYDESGFEYDFLQIKYKTAGAAKESYTTVKNAFSSLWSTVLDKTGIANKTQYQPQLYEYFDEQSAHENVVSFENSAPAVQKTYEKYIEYAVQPVQEDDLLDISDEKYNKY